jgi:hypothetical protein
MLSFVRGRASARRLRLFACACARRAWDRLDAAGRWAVEAAERFADDAATGEELGAARAAAHEAALAAVSGWGANRRHDHAKFAAASAAAPDAGEAAVTASQDMLRLADEGLRRAEEEAAQVADIRCVFGGLFHAVAIQPEWLTSTVLVLARQADEAWEFGAIPILADALQDAGCDSDDLLSHLRGAGPHTIGCWALDLVLGKS